MNDNNEYRVGELAEATGVTRRTIHYYVGRGLLPSPSGAGLGTVYSDEHLYRVLLIKKMQEAYLPLEEIRKRLSAMGLSEVRRLLEYGVALEEMPTFAEEQGPVVGVRYERINLGADIELHYPTETNSRTREMVERILEYVESLSKEV